jgi:hypothetical protein
VRPIFDVPVLVDAECLVVPSRVHVYVNGVAQRRPADLDLLAGLLGRVLFVWDLLGGDYPINCVVRCDFELFGLGPIFGAAVFEIIRLWIFFRFNAEGRSNFLEEIRGVIGFDGFLYPVNLKAIIVWNVGQFLLASLMVPFVCRRRVSILLL